MPCAAASRRVRRAGGMRNVVGCWLVVSVLVTASLAGKRRRHPVPLITSSPPCPSECTCHRLSEMQLNVECAGSELTAAPVNLDVMTSSLDLSMNNFTQVESKAFKGLHFLEKLMLSSNKISRLDPEAFLGLPKLTELGLQDNRLSSVPPRIFVQGRNMVELFLDANMIERLSPDSLYGLRNLEYLYLADNLLDQIPVEALRRTPNLTSLKLEVNRIRTIPRDAFKFLPKLRVLSMRENRISKIDNKAFDSIPGLNIITLSHNDLVEFPHALTKLKSLVQMSFSHNKIETLPDRAFAEQRKLKKLKFEGNPLKLVGRWTFSGLSSIKSISIENVSEQEAFPDFSGCKQLQSLRVTGGRFARVTGDICDDTFVHLTELDVSSNHLTSLRPLARCRHLVKLTARDNRLTAVEESVMRNLTRLRTLDVSGNSISTLSETDFSHNDLWKLNLAYNSFSMLPLRGLRDLRHLNVTGVYSLLYLPPVHLLTSLEQLDAAYPYHCCQVTQQWKRAHLRESFNRFDDDDAKTAPISCYPQPTPLTPCVQLLPSSWLRVMLWVIVVAAMSLHAVILSSKLARSVRGGRSRDPARQESVEPARREHAELKPSTDAVDTFDVSLCHLAVADLAVGAYLLIVLIHDLESSGEFAESGAWWQQSLACRSASFLLVVGVQLGFFTVVIATVERYLATMLPLDPRRHIGKALIALALLSAWIIAIATAVVTSYGGIGGADRAGVLPAHNGAACLPWTTEFPYVAALVGAHLIGCVAVAALCALTYCVRRKMSWLSASKHTRLQLALTAGANALLVLPLALVGLLASAIATYPAASEPWLRDVVTGDGAYDYRESTLDVEALLVVAMLLIAVRTLVNPLLYVAFRADFRRGARALLASACGKSSAKEERHRVGEDEAPAVERSAEFEFRRTPTPALCAACDYERPLYDDVGAAPVALDAFYYLQPAPGARIATPNPTDAFRAPSVEMQRDEQLWSPEFPRRDEKPQQRETANSYGGGGGRARAAKQARKAVAKPVSLRDHRRGETVALPWRPYSGGERVAASRRQDAAAALASPGLIKKLTHSSDSSASKDSGIQSEPDLCLAHATLPRHKRAVANRLSFNGQAPVGSGPVPPPTAGPDSADSQRARDPKRQRLVSGCSAHDTRETFVNIETVL